MLGEQPGILLGSAADTDTPPIYANNWNVQFINNSVIGAQRGPLVMNSSGKILLQDTVFLNVMCR